MNKTDLIAWMKGTYCDIESFPLPKVIGELPAPERLMNKRRLAEVTDMAAARFGEKFARFLSLNTAKSNVQKAVNRKWFYWFDFDNWNVMYEQWKQVDDLPTNRPAQPD